MAIAALDGIPESKRVQKVQKVQRVQRVVVGACRRQYIIRLSADMSVCTAVTAAKRYIKWRRQAPTSPAQRYYITTLGRQALKLSGRRQPVPD